jgi:Transglutaminase-like superfamily
MPLLRLLHRPSRLLAVLFLTALSSPAQTVPAPPSGPEIGEKIFEEWSFLILDGKRCGFDSTVTTKTTNNGISCYRTLEEEQFVVKRLGVNLKMVEISDVIEDADGAVLSFEETSKGAGSDIVSSGRRVGDDLVVSSRGQTSRFRIPRLSALGPEAVRRLSEAVPLKAGQTFSFKTFEGDYPQAPVVEEGTVMGEEIRRVNGVDRNLWKITSASDLAPTLGSISWVDEQNNDVETLVKVPGVGALDEIVSNRAECMKQPEGAELFATSLIRPQRAIPSPDLQARAYYRITMPRSGETLTLWNNDEQRVLSSSPGSAEIEVTVPQISPADATWRLPHANTPEFHPFLQASAYLEVNAPVIQRLARQAVGNERNPVLAAHRIQDFVRDYITKKDLKIGFASAEETAISREGDCTEHAVLCAALGRAVGLPTRCVIGLGYIPPGADEPTISTAVGPDTGIFGFHMWAEAWIAPGKWVPMDAALGSFDVGHIAITKSALEEVNPLVDLNLPVLQMMENIKITLLKTVPAKTTAAAVDLD